MTIDTNSHHRMFDKTISEHNVRRHFQDKARKMPKKERTRGIILDGIVETISLCGLDRTTIKEIVETAGVSHGTFYNHFENRDEAIRVAASSVANEIVEMIIETINRPDKDDEAMAVTVYAFMAAAIAHPSWSKTLSATVGMLDSGIDQSSRNLEMLIERGRANSVFRVAVTPLLSLQVRAIQALAISTVNTDSDIRNTLTDTCEAVLRLLGRTPDEASTAVKSIWSQTGTASK
ncbi:MAG: hypothetical protein COA78_17635 [Blastopirellula sp.]|nr:MAG: hypothetical protein COA78_17635 [Blastopirellula sp.]